MFKIPLILYPSVIGFIIVVLNNVSGDKTYLEILSELQQPKKLILDFTNDQESVWQFINPTLLQGFHFIKQEYSWPNVNNKTVIRIPQSNDFEKLLFEFQDIVPNYCFLLIELNRFNYSIPLKHNEIEELLEKEDLVENASLSVIFSPSVQSSNAMSRFSTEHQTHRQQMQLRFLELISKFKQIWNNIKIGYYSTNSLEEPAISLLDIIVIENSPEVISIEGLTLSYSQFNLQMNNIFSKEREILGKLKPDCQAYIRLSLLGALHPSIKFNNSIEEKNKLYYLILQSAVMWINSGEKIGVMLDGFTEFSGRQRWFENSTFRGLIQPLARAVERQDLSKNHCAWKSYLFALSTAFVFYREESEGEDATEVHEINKCNLFLEDITNNSNTCEESLYEINICKRPPISIPREPRKHTHLINMSNVDTSFSLHAAGNDDLETWFQLPPIPSEDIRGLLNQTADAEFYCPVIPSSFVPKTFADITYGNYCEFYRTQLNTIVLYKSIRLDIIGKTDPLDENDLESLYENLLGFLDGKRKYPDKEVVFTVSLGYLGLLLPESNLYCNSKALFYNENVEIITNFARTFNLRLALKSGIGKMMSWWHELLTIQELNDLSDVNPLFAARNYPRHQLLEGFTADPCINLTKVLPENGIPFGKHSGVVFYFEKGNKTEQEVQTMLKFLFHKFSLIELYPLSQVDFNFLLEELSVFFKDISNTGSGGNGLDLYLRIDCEKINLQTDVSILHSLNGTKIKGCHFSNWESTNFSYFANTMKKHGFKMGLSLEDCLDHVLDQFGDLKMLTPGVLSTVDYILCQIKQNEIKLSTNVNTFEMEKYLDSHLYIKKYFHQWFPHLFGIEINFRLEHKPNRFGKNKKFTNATTEHFLKFLADVNQYAVVNKFNFFITPAFDSENGQRYGWWKITNFEDLSNYSVYVEKESEFLGKETWRPQDPQKLEGSLLSITLLTGFAVLIIITILIIALIVQYYKHRKYSYLSKDQLIFFIHGESLLVESEEENAAVQSLGFPTTFVIQKRKILLLNIIGQGHFGLVYKAQLDASQDSDNIASAGAEQIQVAVKMPLPGCPKESFLSLLSELKVLCYLGNHPNVLGFIGAHVKNIGRGEVYIVTELCEKGSLLEYLQRINSTKLNLVNQYDLARYCHEICLGMEYLQERKVAHGDLSAKNILLDSNMVCKVADFGLSRKLYEYDECLKRDEGLLPWRWLAYESLKMQEYTKQSDVWSFGVTCWEIYSLGCTPYPCNRFDAEFLAFLEEGNRLEMPAFGTREIYEEMLKCWDTQQESRPTFTELADFFCSMRDSNYSKVTKTIIKTSLALDIDEIQLEVTETQV